MIGGDNTAAIESLAALYARWVPLERIIPASLWSAELSKLAANAFLAQRISSINAVSALCEATGADVSEVSYAIGVDSRIGRKHLQASVGFGGTCYETHIRNLVYLCKHYRLGQVATYWESVLKMNNYQKKRFANKIVSSMFNTVSGKKLAVLGFAYKKNTSDSRYSCAIDVCKALLAEKAQLQIHDPRVSNEAIAVSFTDEAGAEANLFCESDPYAAVQGAHALIVLTEWDSFARLDYERIYGVMQRPAFVFDGRNLLDHERLRAIGFQVYGVGKPSPQMHAGPNEAEREAQQRALRAQAGRIVAGAARVEPTDVSEELSEALHQMGASDSLSEGGSPKPALTTMETLGSMA